MSRNTRAIAFLIGGAAKMGNINELEEEFLEMYVG